MTKDVFPSLVSHRTMTDMIELIQDSFYYCGKKYIQRRFISHDLKLLITQDDGFDYVTCYRANKEGKGEKIDDAGMYHENCQSAYPIYTVDSALALIEKLGLTFEFEFIVNTSHYKKTRRKINCIVIIYNTIQTWKH